MNDIEREVRAMLLIKSDHAPHLDEPPRQVLRRARGRQIVNGVAASAAAAAIVIVAIVGAKSLGSEKIAPVTNVAWSDQNQTGPSPKGPCGRGDVVFKALPAGSIGVPDVNTGPTGAMSFKPGSWRTNCVIESLPRAVGGVDDRGREMALGIVDGSASRLISNNVNLWGSSLSVVFFRWTSYCGPATSSVRLQVELGDGSVLFSPYAKGAPACHGGKSAFEIFSDGGVGQDPADTRIPLPAEFRLALKAPASVRRGTTLRYHVAFTNRTAGAVPLDPCPLYSETLTGNGLTDEPQATFVLNCTGAGGVIPQGRTVSFEIRFDLPEDLTPGVYNLRWSFATLAPPLTAKVRVV